jgi:hypothetical protein
LYVDFEADEATLVERARIVGIPDGSIGDTLQYIRPQESLKDNRRAIADLDLAESELRPSLVILDGVTECYALHGWDINKATDAAEFQKIFSNFAEGTASIAIDHAGKDASRGVVGSQHKRAGLNGAEYEFTPKRREGRGGHSEAEIRVTKDRHGYVRGFATRGNLIGRLHVSDTVHIVAPDASVEAFGDHAELLVALMRYVEENPGQSTNKIEKNVTGGAQAIRDGLERLRIEGRLLPEDGPSNARLWYVVT